MVFKASLLPIPTASIDHKEVILLAFGDGALPVTADGMIKLSRRVASVDVDGELKVSAVARCQNEKLAVESDKIGFEPKEAGRSRGILKVAFCEMEVIVAWSLLPFSPFFRKLPCNNDASSSPSEFMSALLLNVLVIVFILCYATVAVVSM
ncbi:hypothetical protein QYE76_051826 [Lolium multiflorum]|uniref:DUF6598 domain-containing protein n=1 Tax=Lolium multiflorum TaxID=4521 RepID=A0AAD8WIA2_LOLMU|nr:hypothetical protein QYE76_051826 [Lolium multiflorum]